MDIGHLCSKSFSQREVNRVLEEPVLGLDMNFVPVPVRAENRGSMTDTAKTFLQHSWVCSLLKRRFESCCFVRTFKAMRCVIYDSEIKTK